MTTPARSGAELEAQLARAREQQAALAQILQAIAASPSDEQHILDTIAETAARYCGANDAQVWLLRGAELERVAHHGPVANLAGDITLDATSVAGRAILERRTIHVADVLGPEGDAYTQTRARFTRMGHRALLVAPIVRDGVAIGSVNLRKHEPEPFTDEQIELLRAFADQAAIAIGNARLIRETRTALERQRAVSDLLSTISGSAFDLDAVLHTICVRSVELVGAQGASIGVRDGDEIVIIASGGGSATLATGEHWPIDHTTVAGRAFLEGTRQYAPDVAKDPDLPQGGAQTRLAIPFVRDGVVTGVLITAHPHANAFDESDIQVLEVFGDQAAIAIENVRLFNETREALEQQTAISEILHVISSSPTDVGPVLEAIARSACRYAAAEDAAVVLVRDGALVAAAHHGPMSMPLTTRLDGSSVTARSVAERRTIHVPDVVATAEYPTSIQNSEVTGQRAILATPLTRGGSTIGALLLRRREPRAFTPRQVELVETFAQQAAIAMENVRLFNETREALAQQTAVAELLKTISRTVFDLEPTLQAVMDNAGRLADSDIAFMNRRDGGSYAPGARYARTPALRDTLALADAQPRSATWEFTRSVMGRMYATGRSVHIPDLLAEPEMREHSPTLRHVGARAVLAVPVRSDNEIIVGCVVARLEPRAFDEHEIRIVETFADQAAIAIHNVRLFNQIQEKSAQLEVANRHKSEFLANMSHELRTPLNAVIGFSEVLLQGIFGDLNEKQREYLEDVLSSGKHLLSLINDILDLSKIEAGRMELDISTFSLANALASGITIVRERAARHGIALAAVVPDDLPAIEADERKVKQVLYNLLSNAVKFTPDGGRVDVRARREDGMVRIEVEDTGIGIAPEDRERVFEEFRQVGRERSREGTGLGLTLTKRFVELHGGRISFESTPGKGSTFAFTLPVRSGATVKA